VAARSNPDRAQARIAQLQNDHTFCEQLAEPAGAEVGEASA
jgi:hypothetical protein